MTGLNQTLSKAGRPYVSAERYCSDNRAGVHLMSDTYARRPAVGLPEAWIDLAGTAAAFTQTSKKKVA
jgi:hypothetical protein